MGLSFGEDVVTAPATARGRRSLGNAIAVGEYPGPTNKYEFDWNEAMPDRALSPPEKLAAFGVAGLDAGLNGGLAPHRLYLLEGSPGSGKTTLALQFLLEGARLGERGLYVTLSETAEELGAVAASHGWRLEGEGVAVFEL